MTEVGGDNWTTGAISRAKLQSNHHHQQTNIQFFTGWMPFPSPNQQCQSTEGKISYSTDLLTRSSPGSLPSLSQTNKWTHNFKLLKSEFSSVREYPIKWPPSCFNNNDVIYCRWKWHLRSGIPILPENTLMTEYAERISAVSLSSGFAAASENATYPNSYLEILCSVFFHHMHICN